MVEGSYHRNAISCVSSARTIADHKLSSCLYRCMYCVDASDPFIVTMVRLLCGM